MKTVAFADLPALIAEIDRLAKTGDWEAAATAVADLKNQRFAPPDRSDIDAMRTALAGIEEIQERAGWLRQDLAMLLKTFDPPTR